MPTLRIQRPAQLKLSIHWPAAKSALLVGALGAGVLSLGLGMVYRVMERENRAFVQQSIGDTAAILASQVRLEIERWSLELTEVGQVQLKPMMLKQETELKGHAGNSTSPVSEALAEAGGLATTAANSVGTVEADSEIVEVSLWKRPEPEVEPRRAMLALNARSRALTPRWQEDASEREVQESKRLDIVFKGHRLVLADAVARKGSRGERLAFVAIPLGHGEVNEVLTAYVSLEKIQRLFSSGSTGSSGSSERFVQAFLADEAGALLAEDPGADPDQRRALNEWSRVSQAESGITELRAAEDTAFTGGFRRVGAAGVTVAASVPASQAGASLRALRAQLLTFVTMVFLGLFAGRYGYASRRRECAAARSVVSGGGTVGANEMHDVEVSLFERELARQALVVALHGSLRGFNPLLESLGPVEAAEAVNDYLTLAASRVRSSGGRFDRSPGISFSATWEFEPGHATEAVEAAVKCAVSLRWDFAQFNELRKLDGKKPLQQGLGMHVGRALIARLGPAGEMRSSAIGDAPACARALDRIGLSAGKELVVSHDVVSALPGLSKAAPLGEAKLTGDTGLTAYYALASSQGSPAELVTDVGPIPVARPSTETRVEIMTPAAARKRWLVNNGSHIVGPFTAEEIAQRLFTQDFDFDCECWSEENGSSARVDSSGMFSGVSDAGASLWIFDGQTIHGPVTEAFVRTAVERAAIPADDAWICEGTTAAGWKRVADYLTARAAGSERDPAAA